MTPPIITKRQLMAMVFFRPSRLPMENAQNSAQDTTDVVSRNDLGLDGGTGVIECAKEHSISKKTSKYSLVVTKEHEDCTARYSNANGEGGPLELSEPHC